MKILKKTAYNFQSNRMLLENDMRKYQSGDSLKQVHWKASAKTGELLSRQESMEVKRENKILIDLIKVEETGYDRLAVEDKILEAALAIANYMKENLIKVTIGYVQEQVRKLPIEDAESFGTFYHECGKLLFNAAYGIDNLLEAFLEERLRPSFYILITNHLTEVLMQQCLKAIAYGEQLVILYVAETRSQEIAQQMTKLENMQIRSYWIQPKTRLEEIIG